MLASDGAGSTLDADKLDGKDSSQFLGSNVVVRTNDSTVLATSQGQGRATCQTGEIALAGGAFMDGSITGDAIMDIHPINSGNNRALAGDTPTGWDVWAYNAHNQSRTLTTYAVCAAAP